MGRKKTKKNNKKRTTKTTQECPNSSENVEPPGNVEESGNAETPRNASAGPEVAKDFIYPEVLESEVLCDEMCELCEAICVRETKKPDAAKSSDQPTDPVGVHPEKEEVPGCKVRVSREVEYAMARLAACDYYNEAQHLLRLKNYPLSYRYYQRAMKILMVHGDVRMPFGPDSRNFRVFMFGTYTCIMRQYRKENDEALIHLAYRICLRMTEIDGAHPLWYKSIANINYYFLEDYQTALIGYLEYVVVGRISASQMMLDERQKFSDCYVKASQLMVQREMREYRPKAFLTSDWINLWALCPCDDVILEDLLSIRKEIENPEKKCPIVKSEYRRALEAMANGYHGVVAEILYKARSDEKRPYRAESFLLEGLIHSQMPGDEVINCLDKFISCWETDQFLVPVRRRKQIFMRYMSLARAILFYPNENLDLSMFSVEECAQFFLQTALTIVLRLQLFKDKTGENGFREANLRKLMNVKKLCKRAIQLDKNFFYAGMLEAYTSLEIEMLRTMSRKCEKNVENLENYIKSVFGQFQREHCIFALWCLCSAYYVTERFGKALSYARKLEGLLLFPGFVSSILMDNEFQTYTGSADDLSEICNKIDALLERDPENFRLYLTLAECHRAEGIVPAVIEDLRLVQRYWPGHIMLGRLPQLINSIGIMEVVWAVEWLTSSIFPALNERYAQMLAGISDPVTHRYYKKENEPKMEDSAGRKKHKKRR